MEGEKTPRIRRRDSFTKTKNPKIAYLNSASQGAEIVAIEGSYFFWRVVRRSVLSNKDNQRAILFTLRNMVTPKEVKYHTIEEEVTEEIV